MRIDSPSYSLLQKSSFPATASPIIASPGARQPSSCLRGTCGNPTQPPAAKGGM